MGWLLATNPSATPLEVSTSAVLSAQGVGSFSGELWAAATCVVRKLAGNWWQR